MPSPGGDRGTKPDKVEVFCSMDKKDGRHIVRRSGLGMAWWAGRWLSKYSPVFTFGGGQVGCNAALDAENN